MKLNGHKIEGPNREIVVIPRGDREDIVFHYEAVLDITEFKKMCPLPRPPMRKIKGGMDVPVLNDSAFKAALEKHSEQQIVWMTLKALEATEGLEWEQVDIGDASTWLLMRKELTDSGFTEPEINRIIGGAISVNSLDEAKVQAARERFLLLREGTANELSSLLEEQNSTQSGELATE